MDWKLALGAIPVPDELRFVQLTPPGSACSMGSSVFFGDPDGDGWAVQQLPS